MEAAAAREPCAPRLHRSTHKPQRGKQIAEVRPSPSAAPKRRRSHAPYLALGISLLLTLAATLGMASSARWRDRARFENAVVSAEDRIRDRFDTYVALLGGGAALFDASSDVSRDEFQRYAERLELRRSYPGVQAIGFSRRVAAGEVAALEAEARAAGAAGFRAWPRTPRAEWHVIEYLEPGDARNRVALGFDMFTDTVRRAAMERARDGARPAMSGRVRLKQEAGTVQQAGFLIYVPVYRGGGRPAGVAERRARLAGFVYAAFRAGDLFAEVFAGEEPPRVDFQVYDGPAARPEALLFDAPREGRGRRPAFRDVRRMEVGGRTLTLVFQSRAAFEAGLHRAFVPAIALAGLAFSLVLFAIARAQARARAEAEERAEALRAALAERERLVALVESSSDFVGVASSTGEVLHVNAAGRRLVGLDEGPVALAGRTMADFQTPEETRRLMEEVVPAAQAGGRWQGEFQMRHFRTGALIPTHLNLFAIHDPHTGEIVGLGAVARDVTAEKRAREEVEAARSRAERSAAESRGLAARLVTQAMELERQVEQARALNDELQRANRAKATFLATMSHELRTPLNAVIGYSDLLLAGIPEELNPPSRRSVERIALASRHLLSVIEEILSHARIEAGRETLSVDEVDLGEVLREVVAIVEPLSAEKKLAFRAPERVRPESMVTDARKLRQILVNLLGNAVKFTARGEIGFAVEARDGHVCFHVRDTGIGIAAGDLERIFEPFRQVDDATTRVAGGTGLGLSVSRHLARMMGGDVTVHSVPGEGSTFTLRLPEEIRSTPPQTPSASSAALSSSPVGRR